MDAMHQFALQMQAQYGLEEPPVQGQLLEQNGLGAVHFGEAPEDSDDEEEYDVEEEMVPFTFDFRAIVKMVQPEKFNKEKEGA